MSPALYNDIWQQLLDAERLSRYYKALADRYHKRYKFPRIIMASASLVAAASFVLNDVVLFPGIVSASVVLIIFAAVVWDFMHDYGEKAAILNFISAECVELETELVDLWRSVYTESPIDEVQANSRLKEIETTLDRVTRRATDAGIPIDENLNEKCQEEGFKVIADRYANVDFRTT